MKFVGILSLMGLLLAGCATQPETDGVAAEWGVDAVETQAAYAKAMNHLDKGRQFDAEMLVADASERHPDSQRLLFLRGTLQCSRSARQPAINSFTAARELEPRSVLGRAADLLIKIDGSKKGLEKLDALIDAHPDEPLLQWLYAMEASSAGQYPERAAARFEQLFALWKVAPVALHLAYAQLLTTGLDQPEKAVDHCQLAAEMEPGPETYQVLAFTLHRAKRYAEADRAYGKLLELVPSNFLYWIQWGSTLAYMGDFSAAAEKFEQAGALNKADVISLLCLGRCLEELGDPAAGFRKYEEAAAKSPFNEQAIVYVAHSQLYGYGTDCNFEAALNTCARPGSSAMDTLREQISLADQSNNPLAPRNSQRSMEHLIALGGRNDPEVQYSLAMIYRHGIGIAKDAAASQAWLERSAKNGHGIAGRMLNPPFPVGTSQPIGADHALLGTWASEGSVSVYEMSRKDGNLEIRGHSSKSGREMLVGNISLEGKVLKFTSYMPTTDHLVEHENRLRSANTMESKVIQGTTVFERIYKKVGDPGIYRTP